MAYFLGLDVGSSATKGIILNEKAEIVARTIVASGLDFKRSSQQALAVLLQQAALEMSAISAACATGYGRKQAALDLTKTEISCHSLAAWHLRREAATLIDIGGQDAKVIHIGAAGQVLDFKMNRSCAAGTGSFLEELSRRAGIEMAALPDLAASSTKEIALNSYCTVFAASELIALAREGTSLADLALAAYKAVVARVRELSPLSGQLLFSGGVVAYHPLIARLLANSADPLILPDSQLAGALGAALQAGGFNE